MVWCVVCVGCAPLGAQREGEDAFRSHFGSSARLGALFFSLCLSVALACHEAPSLQWKFVLGECLHARMIGRASAAGRRSVARVAARQRRVALPRSWPCRPHDIGGSIAGVHVYPAGDTSCVKPLGDAAAGASTTEVAASQRVALQVRLARAARRQLGFGFPIRQKVESGSAVHAVQATSLGRRSETWDTKCCCIRSSSMALLCDTWSCRPLWRVLQGGCSTRQA